MIARPSIQEIENRILQRIRNETTLTADLTSSGLGVLVKTFAAEHNRMWDQIEEMHRQSNISTATGAGLDSWGMMLNAPRRPSRQASTTGFAQAVRFTNLGVADATIPSGTRVYKASDTRIAYYTTASVAIGPGNTGLVHVRAAEIGEIFNVGVGELTRHNATVPSVSVTNILAIQNGSRLETDISYRERILRELQRRNGMNEEIAVALLRSVPGVRDVFLLNLRRGSGTFDAVIVPINDTDASAIVAEAQRLLNATVQVGISARALQPAYRQLDITVSLRFSPDVGTAREEVRELIRAQISSSIENLPVEDGSGIGTYRLNHLRPVAITASPYILDATVKVGLDGSPMSTEGEIRLGVGERITLRTLSVQ